MNEVKVLSEVAQGGLVLTPPTKATPNGAAAEMLNYEVDIGGGYRRIDGYERFDGKTPPSSGWAEEWEWDLGGGGTSPDGISWEGIEPVTGDLGESVTLRIPLNGLSLVGGIKMKPGGEFAILTHELNNAHYTGQVYNSQEEFLDAIIAMPNIEDAYVDVGDLVVESTIPMIPGIFPRLELLHWVVLDDSLTEETLRDAIGAPPGYGPIYGLATFKGIVICARDIDEFGQDSRLYRSTPLGWEAIPLPVEVISTGTLTSATDTTLTNSGATWAEDEFEGLSVLITSGAGEGQVRTIVSNTATTLTIDPEWETIPDGGYSIIEYNRRIGGAVYNFARYNFTGDPAREGLYGADGKNVAFEISGDPSPGVMEYKEIPTVAIKGLQTYYPQRVAGHAMHLFLSFEGGWLQYSGIGDPFSDDPNDGAGGIAYPGTITNLLSLRDNALTITSRESMFFLYGTSELDWQSSGLSAQGDGVGAQPNSLVTAAGTFFADRGGIFKMDVVPAYGNFVTASMSRAISPLYQALWSTFVGAAAIRKTGVYRMYFQAGEWISMTFGPDSILGFGYGRIPVQTRVMCYGTVGPVPEQEEEAIFLGAEDGMVYRMDRGNTFDGEDIPFALRFHFNDGGNMRQRKRWRKAVVEFRTPAPFPLLANAIFDYGSPAVSVHDAEVDNLTSTQGIWNVSEWGEFYWLGKYMSEGEIHINGQGRSVSLMLYGEGRVPSFVIEGYTLHYSPRGLTK